MFSFDSEAFKKRRALTGNSKFCDDDTLKPISESPFINVSGRSLKVPIESWLTGKSLFQWDACSSHLLHQCFEGSRFRGLAEMLDKTLKQCWNRQEFS
ncbi:hypothetical protein CEK25_003359 [Fusarium fujikuroi]|nr:hypothetical protein CEK25_003359 [Fusarium fujikuroi]